MDPYSMLTSEMEDNSNCADEVLEYIETIEYIAS